MLPRRTSIIFIVILAAAGVFGFVRYQQWTRQSTPADSDFVQWLPLSYLEATGDVAIIAVAFGGMATDARFLITTTRQVVTSEGTYADTSTRIAAIGPDTKVQSAASSAPLDVSALMNLAQGTQINLLVQGTMRDMPVVNAYLVIIP